MSPNDREWTPNGRPQSMMALSFSADLDALFGLGALEESVEQRKKALSSQAAELKALEARLQETEAKLKETSSGFSLSSSSQKDSQGHPGKSSSGLRSDGMRRKL